MHGKIKRVIDQIVGARSQGNAVVASLTRAKLAMKGVNVDAYTASSPDDPMVLKKLQAIAAELGVPRAAA